MLKDYINSFTYNGHSSLEYGLAINSKNNVFGAPKPVIEKINIPGRGNIVYNGKTDELDNGEYSDFSKKYSCFMMLDDNNDFSIEDTARAIAGWLSKEQGYKRLDDTYEEGYFREALFESEMSAQDVAAMLIGKIDLTFTCHPFKYSYAGQKAITLSQAATIYNTENFTALPYIKIYGSGTITLYINNRAHTFKDVNGYIEVDSERMTAYKDHTLCNNQMLTTLFPKLAAGQNDIRWSGNVSRIELTPRWCSL